MMRTAVPMASLGTVMMLRVACVASGLASMGRFTQVTLQDLAVQRAVQQELDALRAVQPTSYAFLSSFLNGGLAECGSRLDGLACAGDEYLLALQVAPRLGDVEPARLTARVARSAGHIADAWVRDLDRIASESDDARRDDDDDSKALERWCTLQAAALLVRSKAARLSKDGSLAAQANLAVVAAFAAEWMPQLVRGEIRSSEESCDTKASCDDTAAAALEALASWPLPAESPVDTEGLARSLRQCRVRVASKAARSLHAFKCHDLFDFAHAV